MSAYWKDIFREITNTKGRFLSLLVIAALGAASVVGIQATSIDMRAIADKTYKEHALYDIQIKSTVGFDEDDITAIRNAEFAAGDSPVETVMPAYIFDVYSYSENETRAIRTYSLPLAVSLETQEAKTAYGELNKIELLEGRFPENAKEIAVESRFRTSGRYGIGDKITLGLDNMEDYHDILEHSELTIVGVVKSPLYVNLHERGQTSLGNGRLDYYAYLHPSAYLLDVYTDVYIQMRDSLNMDNLTDEYNTAAAEWADGIKPIGNERIQLKDDELADIRKEIDDGFREYYDGVNELDEKLEEGRRELEEAKVKLDDAKAELEQGQRELDNGISEGLREIDSQVRELNRGQDELNSRIAEWETAKIQIDYAVLQLNETLAKLALIGPQGVSPELDANYEQAYAAIMQLSVQQVQLNEAKAVIDASQGAINDGFRQINDARIEIEKQRSQTQKEIDEGWAEYYNGLEEYESGIAELESEEKDAIENLNEARLELEEARADLENAPVPEWFYFTRKDGVAFESYYQDTLRLEKIGYVFPLVFFLVAILVSLTTMTRMVEERRTQIGVYKAMGYSGGKIMAKYLIYAVGAGLIGGVAGIFAGSYVFPTVITNAYGHLYALPPVDTPVPALIGTLAVIAAVGSVALVTLLTCIQTSSDVPAALMRPKPPRAGKRVMLERIPFLWNRFGFIGKVTARNIFRYKRRFLMTLIGVAGCSALLLTAFGLRDSIGGVAELQFGRVVEYDARAYLKDLTTEEQRSELDSILSELDGEYLYIREESVKAIGNDEDLEVSLIVPEKPENFTDFINLISPESGENLELSGVVITEKLSNKTGVGAGGNMTITLDGGNGEKYTVQVAGVTENYLLNYMYMPPNLYSETFGEETVFNGVYMISDNTGETSQMLLVNENIRGLINTDDHKESVSDSTDALSIVTVVLIVLACALALVVLFNLTNINITERIRELATIKVLGFYNSEMAWYIYRENAAVTIMGILLGLWGGMFLHGFILVTVEVDMLMFPRIVSLSSYVLAAALSAIFAVSVNLIMNFKLSAIDMVESLKSTE